jgi:hypothetical protein
MRTFRWLVVINVLALAAACDRQQQQAQTALTPIGTIRQVMENTVASNADVLFNSVAVTVSASGTDERQPRTDEDWETVEHAAFTLMEATNLLLVPGRRVALPSEEKTSDGTTELPPIKIQEKIDANPDLWAKHVMELRAVGQQAFKATQNHSVQGLFDVGEALDRACENCHLEFWYPDEKRPTAAGAPPTKQ